MYHLSSYSFSHYVRKRIPFTFVFQVSAKLSIRSLHPAHPNGIVARYCKVLKMKLVRSQRRCAYKIRFLKMFCLWYGTRWEKWLLKFIPQNKFLYQVRVDAVSLWPCFQGTLQTRPPKIIYLLLIGKFDFLKPLRYFLKNCSDLTYSLQNSTICLWNLRLRNMIFWQWCLDTLPALDCDDILLASIFVWMYEDGDSHGHHKPRDEGQPAAPRRLHLWEFPVERRTTRKPWSYYGSSNCERWYKIIPDSCLDRHRLHVQARTVSLIVVRAAMHTEDIWIEFRPFLQWIRIEGWWHSMKTCCASGFLGSRFCEQPTRPFARG